MVVAGFLAVISLIQYASKQATYQQARSHPALHAASLCSCATELRTTYNHAWSSDLCYDSVPSVTVVLAADLPCECNAIFVGISCNRRY